MSGRRRIRRSCGCGRSSWGAWQAYNTAPGPDDRGKRAPMITPKAHPCDEAAIRATAAAGNCAAGAKPWVLAATILASSIAYIDGSVVNVALPAIETDLAT